MRVLQESRPNKTCRDVQTRDLLEGWTHVVVQAKKCHGLLPASWRTRKASGVTQSVCEGLRPEQLMVNVPVWPRPADRGVSCVRTSPSPKGWEPRLPVGKDRRGRCLSSEQKEQVQPSSTPSLCSGPMTPSHIREDEFLLSLRIQMLTPSRSTLTNTPRNTIVPAICASLSLVTLTHKINHHTDVSIFQQQSEIQIFM